MSTHYVTLPDAPWREVSDQPAKAAETLAPSSPCNLKSIGTHPRAWEGFGGCFNELGWRALLALPPAARAEILDGLFGEEGLHLDIGRLPMGASDYAIGWHSYCEAEEDVALAGFSLARDEERLFPYVEAALERRPDLRFFASPWSPPTWMKSPPVYNHGRFRMEPAILGAYADYFTRYVEACAARGLTIEAVHVQNEPVADQKFPSCVWTGDNLAEWIGGYLGPRLAASAHPAEIWLGTMNTDDFDRMFFPVLADAACQDFVRGVGLQWDGKKIAHRLAQACPQMRLWQTENECGDGENSWTYAHYVFGLVSHYLSAGTSAYAYWNMVLEPGGTSSWGWRQNSLAVVDPAKGTWAWQPEFYVLKHLAHWVRPGDRVLRLEGILAPWAVGFERADGSAVLAVHNPTARVVPLHAEIGDRSLHSTLAAGSFHTFVL